MSIKEKDLQTINSLSDGDKVRVVTSEGNSRNIPASAISGGSIFMFSAIISGDDVTTDVSYNDLLEALENNQLVYMVSNESSGLIEQHYIYTLQSLETGLYDDSDPDHIFAQAMFDRDMTIMSNEVDVPFFTLDASAIYNTNPK